MKNIALKTLLNLSCVNKAFRLNVLQSLEAKKDLYEDLATQIAITKCNSNGEMAAMHKNITWFLYDLYKSFLSSDEELRSKESKSEEDKLCICLSSSQGKYGELDIRLYTKKLFILTSDFYYVSLTRVSHVSDLECVANLTLQDLILEDSITRAQLLNVKQEGKDKTNLKIPQEPPEKQAKREILEKKYGSEFNKLVEHTVECNMHTAHTIRAMVSMVCKYECMMPNLQIVRDPQSYLTCKTYLDSIWERKWNLNTQSEFDEIAQKYSQLLVLSREQSQIEAQRTAASAEERVQLAGMVTTEIEAEQQPIMHEHLDAQNAL